MKKILLISLLAIFTMPAFSQWTNTVTGTDVYYKIQFPNPFLHVGYVLRNANVNNLIYKTVDAAVTWTPCAGITNHTIHDFYFTDANVGWVCTDSGGMSTNKIHIFRTINAGVSWTKLSVLTGVQATNPKIAVSSGYVTVTETYGVIWSSTDGGINWTNQTFGTQIFNDIEIKSPSGGIGYIGCWDGTFNYQGVLFKSVDSGATWNIHHTFPTLQTAIDCISFFDENTGYVSTVDYMIMRTNNGGTVWDTLPYFKNAGVDIMDLYFMTANMGYAVDSYGNIFKTTDGAQTWMVDFPDDSVGTQLNNVVVNMDIGYATGFNGHVLKRMNANSINETTSLPQSRIYPNPGNGQVQVLFNHNEKTTLQVYSSNGRRVFERTHCKNGMLDLSFLPGGVYVLQFTTAEGYVNQHRLVVQK